MKILLFVYTLLFSIILGCSAGKYHDTQLTLPEGFSATVFADSVGRARHIIVNENGDVYVALRRPHKDGGGIVALRDSDGDGRADIIKRFGEFGGTGIDIRNGYLYFAPDTAILRYKLNPDELLPALTPEAVVNEIPKGRQHAVKPFTFDDSGNLYVDIGAPANACQEKMRTKESPGMDPCPLLDKFAGIWRFKADELGQTQDEHGYRYATGIRHAVALDWKHDTGELYAVQHGRDQLNTLWPEFYNDEQNAELPAEEFFKVTEGSDFGWPYCYYDHLRGKKVLSPEYGGDGQKTDRCESCDDPILAFPGHWAPNDLIFYTGSQFPTKYMNGAFIAFHGSWNRAPLPQKGYKVVFVPFKGDMPSDDYEVFADGFAASDTLETPGDAKSRPMGLAEGPDGSLYVTDSVKGKIWKITYN